MEKEKFLYKYLVNYNSLEDKIKSKAKTTIINDWESYDIKHNTNGLIFYSLHNLLAHDTFNVIKQIENSDFEFEWILNKLNSLSLTEQECINFIEFIIISSNIKKELYNRGYSLYVCNNKANPYRCFSKISDSDLRINIFFHHRAKFITYDISTYNHNVDKGRKEYYRNTKYYLESEYINSTICCHISLNEDKPLPTKIDLEYTQFTKEYLKDNDTLELTTMVDGYWKTFSKNNCGNDFLLEKISEFADLDTIQNICCEVKTLYHNVKQIIRKLGLFLE